MGGGGVTTRTHLVNREGGGGSIGPKREGSALQGRLQTVKPHSSHVGVGMVTGGGGGGMGGVGADLPWLSTT